MKHKAKINNKTAFRLKFSSWFTEYFNSIIMKFNGHFNNSFIDGDLYILYYFIITENPKKVIAYETEQR